MAEKFCFCSSLPKSTFWKKACETESRASRGHCAREERVRDKVSTGVKICSSYEMKACIPAQTNRWCSSWPGRETYDSGTWRHRQRDSYRAQCAASPVHERWNTETPEGHTHTQRYHNCWRHGLSRQVTLKTDILLQLSWGQRLWWVTLCMCDVFESF